MGRVEDLRGSVVGLDTAPLIYFTERHPVYAGIVRPFFRALDNGEITVVTSIATLLEVLVHPLRRGDKVAAQNYRDILLNIGNIQTLDLNVDIAERAAQLRTMYTLHPVDAIQVATALQQNASFFLTNDKRLSVIQELKVLVLDTLQGQP